MNVLSLFDGMSCGQIALKELGIKVENYFSSEIDKYAIAQTQLNFPNTIQLGDVRNVNAADLPKIDLLIGGSPCQGFSFAGKMLNFKDPRSALFFEYVRILKECRERNPKLLFLLENVRMKKEHERVITQSLGLYPVRINSSLVSAQNRERLYWTNIKTKEVGLFHEKFTDIPQPKDRNIYLKDIIDIEIDDKYFLSKKMINLLSNTDKRTNYKFKNAVFFEYPYNVKCFCITSRYYKKGNFDNYLIRKNNKKSVLTPTECARLQTIPDWYKWDCSDTQKYKMLGNGWTIEVIKHIFSFINK